MANVAKRYLEEMDRAIGTLLVEPDSIYFGREGHERFARECGFALNDLAESERKEILSSSYGKLYVKHCNLKPILDAKEWVAIMKSQIKSRGEHNSIHKMKENLNKKTMIGKEETETQTC